MRACVVHLYTDPSTVTYNDVPLTAAVQIKQIKTYLGCDVGGPDAAGGDPTEGEVDQAESGPVVVGGEAVEGLYIFFLLVFVSFRCFEVRCG